MQIEVTTALKTAFAAARDYFDESGAWSLNAALSPARDLVCAGLVSAENMSQLICDKLREDYKWDFELDRSHMVNFQYPGLPAGPILLKHLLEQKESSLTTLRTRMVMEKLIQQDRDPNTALSGVREYEKAVVTFLDPSCIEKLALAVQKAVASLRIAPAPTKANDPVRQSVSR